MKKQFVSIIGLLLALSIATTGCGGSPETSESSSGTQIEEQSPSITQEDETDEDTQENQVSATTELVVRFGVDGEPFTMHLEDNSTAAAIRLSQDGKTLYVSVRGENAIFVLQTEGERLEIVKKRLAEGIPRAISIYSAIRLFVAMKIRITLP